uniref:Uncharacterized protein n=1 Tax=Oryza glumipatula TaxID=40148 RepID=A0A0D9Y9N0_9ORYZ
MAGGGCLAAAAPTAERGRLGPQSPSRADGGGSRFAGDHSTNPVDAAALPFVRGSACFAASSPSPTTAGRRALESLECGLRGIAADHGWSDDRWRLRGATNERGRLDREKFQALAIQVITGPHADVEP